MWYVLIPINQSILGSVYTFLFLNKKWPYLLTHQTPSASSPSKECLSAETTRLCLACLLDDAAAASPTSLRQQKNSRKYTLFSTQTSLFPPKPKSNPSKSSRPSNHLPYKSHPSTTHLLQTQQSRLCARVTLSILTGPRVASKPTSVFIFSRHLREKNPPTFDLPRPKLTAWKPKMACLGLFLFFFWKPKGLWDFCLKLKETKKKRAGTRTPTNQAAVWLMFCLFEDEASPLGMRDFEKNMLTSTKKKYFRVETSLLRPKRKILECLWAKAKNVNLSQKWRLWTVWNPPKIHLGEQLSNILRLQNDKAQKEP